MMQALYKWLMTQRRNHIPISGAFLKTMAKKFHSKISKFKTPSDNVFLKNEVKSRSVESFIKAVFIGNYFLKKHTFHEASAQRKVNIFSVRQPFGKQ